MNGVNKISRAGEGTITVRTAVLDVSIWTFCQQQDVSPCWLTRYAALLAATVRLLYSWAFVASGQNLKTGSEMIWNEMDLKIAPHMNTFTKLDLLVNFRLSKNRERKCADTIGTVLIRWAGHIQCQKYKYIFLIKCTEAILSNSTRKLLWFEISKCWLQF